MWINHTNRLKINHVALPPSPVNILETLMEVGRHQPNFTQAGQKRKVYCCPDHSGLQDWPHLIHRHWESGRGGGQCYPKQSGMGIEQIQTVGAAFGWPASSQRPELPAHTIWLLLWGIAPVLKSGFPIILGLHTTAQDLLKTQKPQTVTVPGLLTRNKTVGQ